MKMVKKNFLRFSADSAPKIKLFYKNVDINALTVMNLCNDIKNGLNLGNVCYLKFLIFCLPCLSKNVNTITR